MKNRATRQANYSAEIRELIQNAPFHLDRGVAVALPIDHVSADMSLEQAITTRTSRRDFSQVPLPKDKLAKVLYLANGIRPDAARAQAGGFGRNVPSAGGLGSVEIYCFVFNVAGVEPGIYHFDTADHELRLVKQGDFETWMDTFGMYQTEFSEAAALLVLTSQVGSLRKKYGLRSYRLALMDVGHVSQNIYLTATALGLAACATAGFVDAEINSALDLDGLDACALLALGIGIPADTAT